MHADLERVIALQRLDSAAQDAQRRLAEEPDRQKTIDARLEAAKQKVADAKARLAESQNARRTLEKDVAVHQGRLSKFRDQLMSVKTNVEYQAMQKEIGFAEAEVKAIEDKVLERMLEGDELAAAVKRADAELAADQKATELDRRTLASDVEALTTSLEKIRSERAALVASIDPQTLAIYDLVAARRHGIAVAEARSGICTICHVRLRPQVFNNIRLNDRIIQCDSCQRILYFSPAAAAPTPDSVSHSTP
jgi:predicted  nucleic acid-binding Zn-ribbon protein